MDTQQEKPGIPDEQLEAAVLARRQRREQADEERESRPDREGTELLKAAARKGSDDPKTADAEELSQVEIHSALEHFLATEGDDTQVEPTTIRLNVGTAGTPQWIRWTIVPVEDATITAIRKNSLKGTRSQRRRGDAETDEALVSRRLVVEGTVDPDPKELAKVVGVIDPADAVQAFFKKYGKTGLITQISGEILGISGWDDEDVQEVEAARG